MKTLFDTGFQLLSNPARLPELHWARDFIFDRKPTLAELRDYLHSDLGPDATIDFQFDFEDPRKCRIYVVTKGAA
jgi:hypothetical protein